MTEVSATCGANLRMLLSISATELPVNAPFAMRTLLLKSSMSTAVRCGYFCASSPTSMPQLR